MAVTAMILGPGDELGGYRLLDVIGVGGMATVYEAEQLSLGRNVALKVLSPAIANDDTFRARFRREGALIAALDHPSVVAIHDSGEIGGHLFLVMRLIRGGTLGDRLRGPGLTARESLDILAPIADALDTAHAQGVVHRDVKPQNILLDEQGHPYLADFGVAKAAIASELTTSGGFIGSHSFAAPEQLRGLAITPATDVYALTAVLFECLTGRPPYQRETVAAVLHAHSFEPPPSIDPRLPAAQDFNRVIARGMAKRPEDRFATATELIVAARTVVDGLPAEQQASVPAFPGDPDDLPGGTGGWERARADVTTVTPSLPADGRPSTDERAAPPETTRPTPGRPRRRQILLGFAVLLAALGIAFFITDGFGVTSGSPAPKVTHHLSAAPFRLTYKSPWRPVSSAVTGSFALANAGAARLRLNGATLAAGRLSDSAPVPGGVPPQLRSRFGPPRSTADVLIAGVPARTYTWSTGSSAIVAYALPAPAGDAAIICATPAGSRASARACAAIAEKALVSGQTLAPGPDRPLAAALRIPLAHAATLQRSLQLPSDGSLTSSASATAAAAATQAREVSALRRVTAPARYQTMLRELDGALGHETEVLKTLGPAASADNRAAYANAAAALAAASRSVRSVAARFAPFGLGLPDPGLIHLTLPAVVQAPQYVPPTPPPTHSSAGTSGTHSTASRPSPTPTTKTTVTPPA